MSERCQYFMIVYNLKSSMSCWGNCYDNVIVESFFQLLKWECIKKWIYKNREEVKVDIFDYVEMFYNVKCCYSVCEYQFFVVYESVWFMRYGIVQEIRVYLLVL